MDRLSRCSKHSRFQKECQLECQKTSYAIYTSRWYVRNYVRIHSVSGWVFTTKIYESIFSWHSLTLTHPHVEKHLYLSDLPKAPFPSHDMPWGVGTHPSLRWKPGPVSPICVHCSGGQCNHAPVRNSKRVLSPRMKNRFWLVVEPTPLKNMTSSIGMMTCPNVPKHQPRLVSI